MFNSAKWRSKVILNKDMLMSFITIVIIFILSNRILNLVSIFYIQSRLFQLDLLPSNQLEAFRFKVISYRIFVYFILPFLSYLCHKYFILRIFKFNKINVGIFYESLFVLIALITTFYIFLAYDISQGFMIFSSSDTYLAVIGFLVVKLLNKEFNNADR